MVFFHQIFLVDLLIRKLSYRLIPGKTLPTAQTDISHLGYRRYMGALLYGTMQVLHFTRTDHTHEIGHMFVQPIVGGLFKRLADLMLTLLLLDHLPATTAEHQRAVIT